jgi:hypothetical protein
VGGEGNAGIRGKRQETGCTRQVDLEDEGVEGLKEAEEVVGTGNLIALVDIWHCVMNAHSF